jgi:hypothetical protein
LKLIMGYPMASGLREQVIRRIVALPRRDRTLHATYTLDTGQCIAARPAYPRTGIRLRTAISGRAFGCAWARFDTPAVVLLSRRAAPGTDPVIASEITR